MVQISDGARKLLLKNLVDASVSKEMGYRLAESSGSYQLQLDRPDASDRVLRGQGHVVFIVEPELDEKLEGIVIELMQEDETKLTMQTV